MESIFEYMQKYDFENLVFCQNKALDFKAIIAIHDTTLGPAAGGCRMWQNYPSEMDAIEDALRLAKEYEAKSSTDCEKTLCEWGAPGYKKIDKNEIESTEE